VELAEVIGTLASAALDRVAGSEAHLRSVAQNPFDVITIVNPEGRITHQSASIEQAFGYLPRSMIGEELTSWFHPEDVDKLSQFLDSTNNEETASGLVWARMRHRDGTWRVGESAVSTLHDPTTQGIVLITRDVSEQFPLDSELGLRGMQDSLTGLANRELFIDRLNNALARRARDRRPLSVLLVDVDELAHINDKLGRGAGDLVLQQTGERLEKCIRPSDLVARFGANEFALLLENADAPTADIIAKRILAAFIPPFSILDGEEPVGVTVGAAVTLDRETSDEMLQGAQAGMQAARSRGEDRYQLFGSEKHEAAADRSALRKDLEWALLRAELVIHYQPVVDLVSGSISGFEALVRWNHPSRGLLGPDQFLDLAEENGTIISIGGWVLRFACQQVAVWRRAIERDLTIAVNMSDRQLQDPGLEAKVRAALAASELPASALVIEVMESATVEETTGTIEILNSLKQIGVKVAIDDFGNGFSSLSHLRDYPVDQLKMDRSFVSDVVANPEDHAVVSSVISLGHALDLCVVAVGVETPDQLNELREMGCDQGQGFRWRKPSPAQSVSDWLASLDDHAVAV
jgi:diguanylate cyclase (GGDEF)-like protein/PAS domain S-box-containing protein